MSAERSTCGTTRSRQGWITLILGVLTAAGALRSFDPMVQGALVRTFIEALALYLAWPELVRLPKWIWTAIPVVIIVGAFRPQFLIFAIPALLLVIYLTPKRRGKS